MLNQHQRLQLKNRNDKTSEPSKDHIEYKIVDSEQQSNPPIQDSTHLVSAS
jgi:hypothetical protein